MEMREEDIMRKLVEVYQGYAELTVLENSPKRQLFYNHMAHEVIRTMAWFAEFNERYDGMTDGDRKDGVKRAIEETLRLYKEYRADAVLRRLMRNEDPVDRRGRLNRSQGDFGACGGI